MTATSYDKCGFNLNLLTGLYADCSFDAISVFVAVQSNKIGNDQELIQSEPISRPQSQKEKKYLHELTAVNERRAQ